MEIFSGPNPNAAIVIKKSFPNKLCISPSALEPPKDLSLDACPSSSSRLLNKVFWIIHSTLVFWLILQLSYNGEQDICIYVLVCQLKQDCHDGGVPVIATTSVEILLSSFEDQSRTLKCLDGRRVLSVFMKRYLRQNCNVPARFPHKLCSSHSRIAYKLKQNNTT